MKKTIDDINVSGKKVLVRLDLNVPLDKSGAITDDRRIQSALPTVKKLLADGGSLILMSHLGRPKDGGPEDREKFTLAPAAKRMSELIGKEVKLLNDCVGQSVKSAVASMGQGDVLLLENLRFHPAETIKDKKAKGDPALRKTKDDFAAEIAGLGDVYVNDAFGTCHRDNASMYTVPAMMEGKPRVVGYLVRKELEFLGEAVANPKRPFVCVLGGAKVSDKLGVIESLLSKCDTIVIGGAMAYTFLSAEGVDVGNSLVEPDLYDTAKKLRVDAGDKLKLPMDSVAAGEIAPEAAAQTCDGAIPEGMMGLDIGPATIGEYKSIITSAKTVVWNGPMGVFETPPFDRGTMAIAEAMAQATAGGTATIIGGGDSAAAIDKAGLSDKMTHISTGGGASLEFLEGKEFVTMKVIDNA